MNKTTSPTRTYMAIIVTHQGNHAFRKFTLPETSMNDSHEAEWYYMNRVDFESVLIGCVTVEDYSNVKDVVAFKI